MNETEKAFVFKDSGLFRVIDIVGVIGSSPTNPTAPGLDTKGSGAFLCPWTQYTWGTLDTKVDTKQGKRDAPEDPGALLLSCVFFFFFFLMFLVKCVSYRRL